MTKGKWKAMVMTDGRQSDMRHRDKVFGLWNTEYNFWWKGNKKSPVLYASLESAAERANTLNTETYSSAKKQTGRNWWVFLDNDGERASNWFTMPGADMMRVWRHASYSDPDGSYVVADDYLFRYIVKVRNALGQGSGWRVGVRTSWPGYPVGEPLEPTHLRDIDNWIVDREKVHEFAIRQARNGELERAPYKSNQWVVEL